MFSVLGKNGFHFYRFMDRNDRFMHVIHKQFQTNINTEEYWICRKHCLLYETRLHLSNERRFSIRLNVKCSSLGHRANIKPRAYFLEFNGTTTSCRRVMYIQDVISTCLSVQVIILSRFATLRYKMPVN